MDLDRFPRGKAFYLDYHLFDITKLSPERYFDYSTFGFRLSLWGASLWVLKIVTIELQSDL